MIDKYTLLLNILDKLRQEAPEKFKRYYPKKDDHEKLNQARSRAYIHLFLKVKFGILNFSDRENFITDDSGDGGIDAYYISDSEKTVYFIQSKFRTTKINFESKDIKLEEILSMDIDRITDGETEYENGAKYNGKILKLIKKIGSISDIGKYSYKAIILANVKEKFKPSDIKKMTGGFSGEVYNFEKCYNELIFPLVSGTFYNVKELYIQLNLSKKTSDEISYSVKTEFGSCDITVVFVPIIEIAKIMHKFKNSILKFNPRSFLDLKRNSVNKAIENTVKRNQTNEFALFNNGITMLSDDTNINKKIGRKDQAQMIVINPQIINGGQTAYTLSRLYEETIENGDQNQIFKNKEVILKIITFSKDEDMPNKKKLKLIEEISKATNQQSPVNDADRRSNDSIQIEIQEKIYKKFGYFYERKKGEFGDGLHNDYISRDKVIDRTLFLRICVALKGDVSRARRSSERVLFEKSNFDKALNTNINYEKAFYAYAAWILLGESHKEYSAINKKKGENLNYGYAFSYGKFAVVSVVASFFSEKSSTDTLVNEINKSIKLVLSAWPQFESKIVKMKHNSSYFKEIKDTDTGELNSIYEFPNYYKGRTVNKDLENYFKKYNWEGNGKN